MPLRDVSLREGTKSIPLQVRRFLHDADQRIERFQRANCIPGFVPSDFEFVYRSLRTLAESAIAPGSRFCEWGSGFGVVACLAAMIGFDACGLEIEGDLVDESRRLAGDFELPVEFVCGSFIPLESAHCIADADEYSWLTVRADGVSAVLGIEPDEYDVVFAYPWPDEEKVVSRIFDESAGNGAVLVTYHGEGVIRMRKKISGSSRRR